jgi:hypothetical protein
MTNKKMNKEDEGNTVFDKVLSTGAALSGGIAGTVTPFISAGVNMFAGLFRSHKSQKNVSFIHTVLFNYESYMILNKTLDLLRNDTIYFASHQ